MIKALLSKGSIVSEHSQQAMDLCNKKGYGKKLVDGRVQLSWLEAMYLVVKKKIDITDSNAKSIPLQALRMKASRANKEFPVRFAVFSDLRSKGYTVKSALKFGLDFRVYEKGALPGDKHAKWVVFPVHESKRLTWLDFSAKNRVAHSTKKKLLLAVVDDELDVTYWESSWVRP